MVEGSAAESEFNSFNWSESKAWQSYFDGLFPTPPASRVNYFKRKWFRAHVNGALELAIAEADSSGSSSGTTASSDRQTPYSPSSHYRGGSTVAPLVMSAVISRVAAIAVLLLASFCFLLQRFLPLGIFQYWSLFFVLGFILDVVALHGRPKFSSEYLQAVITSEAGQAIFLAISSAGMRMWLFGISPLVTAVLLLSERSKPLLASYFPAALASGRLKILRAGMEYLDLHRYQIMQTRANLEVMAGFSAILMLVVLRQVGLISVAVYWNALRFRYEANPFTQATFRALDLKTQSLLAAPIVPAPIRSGYQFIRSRLSSLATSGGAHSVAR